MFYFVPKMECDLGFNEEEIVDDVTKSLQTFDEVEDDEFLNFNPPSKELNTWTAEKKEMNYSVSSYEEPSTSTFDHVVSSFSGIDHRPPSPLSTLNASSISEAGVCGLWNLGNTCFLSAGVQCLMVTMPIVNTLLSLPIPTHHSLTLQLAELAKIMWSGKVRMAYPFEFKSSLVLHFPQFNGFRQHDCQEFLALLLNGLHEQMNTALKNKSLSINHDECYEVNEKKKNFSDQFQSTSKANLSDENVLFKLNNRTQNEKCDKNCDKRLNNGCKILDNILNNQTNFTGLDDIIKETSTTDSKNVLVNVTEANNELRFDSEKFPRNELLIRNPAYFQLYENNTGGKRCKMTVQQFSSPTDFKDGLDMKRVKLNSSPTFVEDEKNSKLEKEMLKSPEYSLEKNERMECERKETEFEEIGIGSTSAASSNLHFEASAELDADKHWMSHLSANSSVIVETFQGQFKSTVICASCQFVSVTYEPFMYLSVPLPNVIHKIISVTFVSDAMKLPQVYTLEMNKYCDSIGTLKEKFVNDLDSESPSSIVIAEVFQHHIAKILEDTNLIKHLNHSDRLLYAFKKITLKDQGKEEDFKSEENQVEKRCIICLEDVNINMKTHENCACIICDVCIEASMKHLKQSGNFECPVCKKMVNINDLSPVEIDKEAERMLNIPLVFRVDSVGGNNNQKAIKLFGHPRLLRLPNLCPTDSLKETIANLSPYSEPYKLLLVTGKGDRCSRCMFTTHCHGCEVPDEPKVHFKSGDSLALSFATQVDTSIESTVNDKQLEDLQPNLTLEDCIQSFSKSELLDSSNPWYCPSCKENRCATKTLTIWRYPKYLIVYLKRFVFHNHISTKLREKVIFPISGLSFSSCESNYDLYACVCHIGGVSSGHYTSYTQHPKSNEWHYFNDSEVVKRGPQEEDFSNAYILFYKKQGS